MFSNCFIPMAGGSVLTSGPCIGRVLKKPVSFFGDNLQHSIHATTKPSGQCYTNPLEMFEMFILYNPLQSFIYHVKLSCLSLAELSLTL